MRSLAHLWPIFLLACVDRPLGDSATGDASTGATGTTATTPSSASDTTPGTTTPPTTGPATTGPATTGPSTTGPSTTGPATTGPSTSTSTTGPSTTGPSSAVTTDVSTTSDPSDTTTTGVKPDLPRFMPPPPGLVGCTFDAPSGTAVKGLTGFGPFESGRAYFGAVTVNGILAQPTLVFLAPEANASVELVSKQGDTGPIVNGFLFTPQYDAWLGEWEFNGSAIVKGNSSAVPMMVQITELAGNWDAPDPNDPPRLVGAVAGDLAGPLDAVYCDKLDDWVIAE